MAKTLEKTKIPKKKGKCKAKDKKPKIKKEKKVKWICRKCGLIYESERALKNCPGCEHPQAYFEILAENY